MIYASIYCIIYIFTHDTHHIIFIYVYIQLYIYIYIYYSINIIYIYIFIMGSNLRGLSQFESFVLKVA